MLRLVVRVLEMLGDGMMSVREQLVVCVCVRCGFCVFGMAWCFGLDLGLALGEL